MKILRKFFFVASLAGIGLAGCKQHPAVSSQAPDSAQAAGSSQVAAAAAPDEKSLQLPAFELRDLQGHEISSAALRGKVVLIDFWATWCQPCKKEMPGYQHLLDRYGPRGFAVIGFKFDTMADTEDPLKFAHRIGVRYPLAIASDELKQKFGGIEGLPTTLLFDRQGMLRKKVIGFEYPEVFESAIKPLL